MEEKEILTEEVQDLEVQDTFNTDGMDVLVDSEDCTIENQEEVEADANENN